MSESSPTYGAHLRAALLVGAAVVFALAGIEALATSHALTAADMFAVFVYLTGFYGLALAPGAVLLGLATSLVPARGLGSPSAWVAGCGVVASLVTVTYQAVLTTRPLFSNVELGALLVAVITGGAAVVLAIAAHLSLRAARTPRIQWVVALTWGAIAVSTSGALIRWNLSGFQQLSGWLLPMPIALAGIGILALATRNRLLAAPSGVLAAPALVLLAIGAGAAMEYQRMDAPQNAATQAPLLRWIAPAVHAATDFDDDGFSGLMGGGDCAPRDPTIAPGKLDVPGDGIDNNCLGGDASGDVALAKPIWSTPPKPAPELDVLIVTVETLRADHVGFMGYHRKTTPNLDAIASSSAVFEHFYASSTFTRLSLPSLLTSRTPSRIAWQKQPKTKFPRIADSNPWLPEAFKNSGYKTASFTADFPAFTATDSIGFDRAFGEYDASTALRYKGGTMRGFPSIQQVKRVNAWLDARGAKERLFTWVHLFEPHYLYEQFPGAPVFGKSRVDRYDSEIWGADKAIGDIVDHLKSIGRWDRTILVVLGDHGEEFDEHGQKYHGANLYEPQVRIPLLLRVPGHSVKRIAEPASMVDLAPTLLNLANVRKGFDAFEGRNLVSLLTGEAPPAERPLFLEVWNIKTRGGRQVAAVSWPYKIIGSASGRKAEELFNLARDPKERDNLINTQPDAAKAMRRVLHSYIDGSQLQY